MEPDMSLTPEEMQARAAHAREIYASVDRERLVRHIVHLFDLEAADEPDEFTYPAFTRPRRQRIFGGQVIAQAMVAAARTVDPGKSVHSLHAYFLRGGDEAKPLHFRVHRDFDGRSFANRRVVVRQDGKVIFNLTASFQAPEKGLSHQIPMTGILPPEECWDFADFVAVDPKISDRRIEHMARMHPFEVRAFRPPPSEKATMQYEWFRISSPVGDDPLIHRALLAYASDMGLLSTTMMPHGLTWDTPGVFSTSLDHAMWFHDDISVDEWFVYVMDSDWSGGGRGINRGRIYRRDGTLIASAVQEGLIRYDPPA
jgi:acyl-CoA thioesterase II